MSSYLEKIKELNDVRQIIQIIFYKFQILLYSLNKKYMKNLEFISYQDLKWVKH